MKVWTLGLLVALLATDSARAIVVSAAPPPPAVAPPAAPDVGVVVPQPEAAAVPLADPPAAPTVTAIDPPAPPLNAIAPPAGPVVFSIDPGPADSLPVSLNAVSDPVPGPIGVVGLVLAAGVLGVRRVFRRRATDSVGVHASA